MPVTSEIDTEHNLIVHTVTEYMDMSILVNTISETLKNPAYKAGMNAIWHFDHIDNMNISSSDLMFVADFASKNIDTAGEHYCLALVAEEDLAFGLTRVYEAWSSERPVTISNFRNLEDARKWIQTEK